MPIQILQHIISQHTRLSSYFKSFSPSSELQEYIEGIYLFSCLEQMDALAYNDGTPMLALFLNKEDEAHFTYQEKESTFLSGWLSTRTLSPMNIRLSSSSQLLVARFKPDAFYTLFALEPRKYTAQPLWSLEAWLQNTDEMLYDFYALTSIKERIRIIEDYLRKHITFHRQTRPLFQDALSYVQRKKGNLTIEELSTHLGVNYKWLERHFSTHLGLSPKTYSSLQRFMHAFFALKVKKMDLITVAALYGYADTNHLIKDFKRYVGKTPGKC